MQQPRRKSGQFVVPGERLGVIEEFTPGLGTYVDEGKIYSKITGRALLDLLNKKVSVYPLVHAANTPKVGSVVVGQVLSLQDKSATVRVSRVDKKEISGIFTGVLHVSDASQSYTESMFDVCKMGDIVRAKVVSDKNRTYHLSTADQSLGVIYALCAQCGHILQLKRQRLRCPRCGKIEKRKVASDYGGEIA